MIPETTRSTPTPLWFGYLDESGDVALFSGTQFFLIAILLAVNPRPIELHIKRARKALGRKARIDELKASQVKNEVTTRLLQALATEKIEIVAVIVDKQAILRPPDEPEDIYREAVTRGIRYCVERHSHIEFHLDKRYTQAGLRQRLERSIREKIAHIPEQVVLLYQDDSRQERGLQAVDHIAWSLYQKYEQRDERYYQVIEEKVVYEEVVIRHLW